MGICMPSRNRDTTGAFDHSITALVEPKLMILLQEAVSSTISGITPDKLTSGRLALGYKGIGWVLDENVVRKTFGQMASKQKSNDCGMLVSVEDSLMDGAGFEGEVSSTRTYW